MADGETYSFEFLSSEMTVTRKGGEFFLDSNTHPASKDFIIAFMRNQFIAEFIVAKEQNREQELLDKLRNMQQPAQAVQDNQAMKQALSH
ncbi:hypothetical protein NO2_0053 [Candidatus Termititenax persephonae]|uniref:Uncharacterized protein n=1 Tax=Candidatus Termititenax persephonae TaxID=2218525 RepID=A0A388TF69_9BACT|nr:hypothetical protein NO2_0053 [Candidatus Termititenax persephonae]